MNDQQSAPPEGNESKTNSGGSPLDTLTGMPEQTLLLIVWGGLGLLLIGIFLPWISSGGGRPAQSFRKESISVDSAMRNTHMHEQVGVRDGRDRIRTCEGVRQQIYSLPPLSTWVLALLN